MDAVKLKRFADNFWEESILPSLTEYIRIPNKSPDYDPQWVEHGYMKAAVTLMEAWARRELSALPGATIEVVTLPGRTPVIFMDIPGDKSDTVLVYGHLDKQPEMLGWSEGLGPWTPVRKDEKLYGRGSSDDGYAIYAAIGALRALREQKVPRARCVVLIEACEESGSYDLPYYVDHLADRLGQPSLVVCLDSGCGNYDQLWLTTSLRGIAALTVTVRVLSEGVHSGDSSGIVPSSFRILRALLSRIEDENTGAIKLRELYTDIPLHRIEQAKEAARILGTSVYDTFPFASKTQPVSTDLVELVLNRAWRPQLAVVGMEGYPAPENAGNVLLPYSTAKLSMRLPPTLNAKKAVAAMKAALQSAPPYGAQIECAGEAGEGGWNAPALAPWLEASVKRASEDAFGRPPAYQGEGGSIPFMGMLGEKFPETQFVITGVLGPHSNAHGPNEFLHIPVAKNVTAAIARILADHFTRTD